MKKYFHIYIRTEDIGDVDVWFYGNVRSNMSEVELKNCGFIFIYNHDDKDLEYIKQPEFLESWIFELLSNFSYMISEYDSLDELFNKDLRVRISGKSEKDLFKAVFE